MPSSVFLGLGSNLGDRETMIKTGLLRLEALGFQVTARSSFYLTEPVGGPPQGWFVNSVVRGETVLEPRELLKTCLATERELGRLRLERNGPRVLDIDILLYGDLMRDMEGLEIPHPRLQDRRFVLAPLVELAPDLPHPILGRTMQDLLEACPDTSTVVLHTPAEVPL